MALSGKALWGSLFVGWGLFNLVEGIIDHEILGIHHVYQNGNHIVWDLVFLGVGALEILAGILLIRAGFVASHA